MERDPSSLKVSGWTWTRTEFKFSVASQEEDGEVRIDTFRLGRTLAECKFGVTLQEEDGEVRIDTPVTS